MVAPVVDAAARKKAVEAATIGNFVEWYDFIVYGYFATVIGAQFFPPMILWLRSCLRSRSLVCRSWCVRWGLWSW